MRHKHFLAGHANGIERRTRRLAGEPGQRGGDYARSISNEVGQLHGRGLPARNSGEFAEDLGQRQVFRSEDVTLAWLSVFASLKLAQGYVARVYDVQAGVDKGGHGAFQKIQNDRAGGGGLDVVISDRRGGIDDDDGQSGGSELERFTLGKKLGALVGPRHLIERYGLVFIADAAMRHADAANGTGVDDAIDAGFAGGFEHVAGAIDIGAVEFVLVAGPEAIIGSNVKDQAAAGSSTVDGFGIAQIAGYGLGIQFADFAGGADQRPYPMTALDQKPGYVPAQEDRKLR